MRALAAAVEPPAARDRNLHGVGRVGGEPRPLPAPPAQAEHRPRLPLPPAALLASRSQYSLFTPKNYIYRNKNI